MSLTQLRVKLPEAYILWFRLLVNVIPLIKSDLDTRRKLSKVIVTDITKSHLNIEGIPKHVYFINYERINRGQEQHNGKAMYHF